LQLIDTYNAYKQMVTIRTVESRLQELCLKGEAGDLHFSKGQEAISVGVCSALRQTDYIVTHHRTIAHEIAKGSTLRPLIAEVLGKATGINKGLAGEMHINNPTIRHMFSFQLVGTCVPVATGLAYAIKYHQKTDDVVAVFFGDAATSNGQVHEALNIAKIKQVPLLLVCENNGLAGNIRKEYYLPTATVSERMTAYGIRSSVVDGNDVEQVFVATKSVVDGTITSLKRISLPGWAGLREESKPFLLEMNTTRLCWHKQGQKDIRSPEEIQELAKRDPILLAEQKLGFSPDEKEKIWAGIEMEVEKILQDVMKDPSPNSLAEVAR
jgi:TPP-dependent pyruvate/acetoin dehydrogenase alpha subunit